MIYAEMTGTNTVTACGITRNGRGYSSGIGPLCRDLIAAGYAAHDIVIFKRGETPAFRPTTLQWFADSTASESVYRSAYVAKWSPRDFDEDAA